MPKIKLTTATQEDVTFTHFHIKSITLSQAADQNAKFRIDIVGQRFALDGTEYIYENKLTTFTNTDFVPLVKVIMNVIDGIPPASVETQYSVAMALADKGNAAEQFASMLELAGENVPEAAFVKRSMTSLGFREDSFDGLTAFYSIIHVPRERHSSLFDDLHRILKNMSPPSTISKSPWCMAISAPYFSRR